MFLLIVIGRAFHRVGPATENALEPVLVFTRGTQSLLECDDLSCLRFVYGTRRSDRYAGWLSVRARKVSVHILKWMRNVIDSQCKDFNRGTDRMNRGALVTTLARQF